MFLPALTDKSIVAGTLDVYEMPNLIDNDRGDNPSVVSRSLPTFVTVAGGNLVIAPPASTPAGSYKVTIIVTDDHY